MRFNMALMLFAGLTLGSLTVLACSSDDDPTPASGTVDSGTTTPGTDDDDKVDSGGTNPGVNDAGTTADASDGGNTDGKKALGEACTTASDTSTECASGVCASFGGGGGSAAARTLCSIKCSGDATKCAGQDELTGMCNGKGYCGIK